MSLQYASDEMKADQGVVLKAVKQNRKELKYASDDLKAKNKQVVLIAVKQNGIAINTLLLTSLKDIRK